MTITKSNSTFGMIMLLLTFHTITINFLKSSSYSCKLPEKYLPKFYKILKFWIYYAKKSFAPPFHLKPVVPPLPWELNTELTLFSSGYISWWQLLWCSMELSPDSQSATLRECSSTSNKYPWISSPWNGHSIYLLSPRLRRNIKRL